MEYHIYYFDLIAQKLLSAIFHDKKTAIRAIRALEAAQHIDDINVYNVEPNKGLKL